MRLVIREYISMLKEADELDALLPDLLLSMGLQPLSRPGRGVRQYGVDLPAVGTDPEDGREKLFLFVIKQGNLDRRSWSSDPQAVRQSIEEIFDVFLSSHVQPEHKDLVRKVVVATSGEMDQAVQASWAGFISNERTRGAGADEVEFGFWGADKLAQLAERFLLDEYLFPESARSKIRKTIALADQNETEPYYFYSLVEDVLFEKELRDQNTTGARRKREHALRLLNLSLNIVYHWCREADNLLPAVLCGERTILRVWEWLNDGLRQDKSMRAEYTKLLGTHLRILRALGEKVQPHCMARDGFFRSTWTDLVEYPVRIFEVLGLLAELILLLEIFVSAESDDDPLVHEQQVVGQMIKEVLKNNTVSQSPCFDRHAIDIGLVLVALKTLGLDEVARAWVAKLSLRISFAYKANKNFPLATDSYEDLISMRYADEPPRKDARELSTIVPLLADWHAILGMQAEYKEFRRAVAKDMADVDLQMWLPDEATEEILYREHAGETGLMISSISLPENLSRIISRFPELHRHSAFMELSCISEGLPVLGVIASRHFRTPLVPSYWQNSLRGDGEPGTNEQEEGTESPAE